MKLGHFLKKVDLFLDRHVCILILFILIILLRVPNFFEPYWYGDEAIYLTLGNAIKNGGQLYTTIIDHKTPIIYYLATVPNQFYFRVLNLFWVLATTGLFFTFAKTLFKKVKPAFIASLIMVVLTTLPWLEGNIPNGELFVMGFVMAGAVLFTHTSIFKNFFGKNIEIVKNKKDSFLLMASGFMMSLGILTKVPAILDVASFLSIFWLVLVADFFNVKSNAKKLKDVFFYLFNRGVFFVVGLLIPIAISIIYFVANGHGSDYLDYGLLYNLRYSQSWSHDFGSNLINFAFSMPGKTLILLLFFILISLNANQFKKRFQFISLYFIFTLYSVLLSSRPYPHYFIQMVPAFALLLTEIGLVFNKKGKWLSSAKTLALSLILLFMTGYVMLAFEFKPYPSFKYYNQFFKYATGKISKVEYENSFDTLISDNREVTKLIQEMNIKKMFIWGTNPLLYAQSKTIPTSRFTVSFHIKDFNDYDQTFAQIEKDQPKLIIIMKNETQSFPALETYITRYYIANYDFEHMTLYLRK